MSLINQVLNQLEQRGAKQLDIAQMVRSVPGSRYESKISWQWGWLVLLIVIILLAFVGWWQLAKKHPSAVAVVPPVTIVPPAAVAVSPAVLPITMPASDVVVAPVLQLSFALDTVVLPSLEEQPKAPTVTKSAPAITPAKTSAKLHEPVQPLPNQPVVVLNEMLPVKQINSKQQAEAIFRKAVLQMQQGRINEALAGYRAALDVEVGYEPARQALVSLLLENKQREEAEQVLQEGLSNHPEQTAFVMMVARLQVERQAVNEALLTLEKSLSFAQQQGDYQAFYAALLQRKNRHQDALLHYQLAVQLVPNNGLWLMGEGISLQVLQRNEEAKELYKRALLTQKLPPDLQIFVQQKLKSLP